MTTSASPRPGIRAATAEDAEAILDLHVLCDLASLGEVSTSVDEVSSGLERPSIRNGVLRADDGTLIGHAWIEHQDGHEKTWGDLEIRPGCDRAVAAALLDWLIAASRELAPGRPMHVFTDSKNTAKRAAYEALGGRVIREFCRMEIRLDQHGAEPGLPRGVTIRSVDPDDADLRTAHRIYDTAFADHFGHEAQSYEDWLALTVNGAMSDLSLWWLACVDGEPAAVLYGTVLPTAGYIDTLATLAPLRGRGLGRALMLTAFAAFRRRGLEKAVLGVDATNPTGARALYESLGMRAGHVGLRYEIEP